MVVRHRADRADVALGHLGLVGKVVGRAQLAVRLTLLVLMLTRHALQTKRLSLVQL